MDGWITRWETRYGVAPRLSQFFARPEARDLLRAVERESEIRGDVEVFAFLLILFVWPEEEWQKQPSGSVVQESIRRLEQARRSLGRLSNTGWLGTPERVHEVRNLLGQWAGILRVRTQSVTVGTQTIGGKPPAHGKQRGKRKVVFFLTRYFKTLGYRRTPWGQITRFLILCRLVPPRTTAKKVATWWSTLLQRDRNRPDCAVPLEQNQQDLLLLFQLYKTSVWSPTVPASALQS